MTEAYWLDAERNAGYALGRGPCQPRLLVEHGERPRELHDFPGFPASKTEHGAQHFRPEDAHSCPGDTSSEAGSTLRKWRRWREASSTRSSSTSCSQRCRRTAPPSTSTS